MEGDSKRAKQSLQQATVETAAFPINQLPSEMLIKVFNEIGSMEARDADGERFLSLRTVDGAFQRAQRLEKLFFSTKVGS